MINISRYLKRLTLLCLLAAAGVAAWGAARMSSTEANAATAAPPQAVSSVPAGQADLFRSLRTAPATRGLPDGVRRFVERSLTPKFGASSTLARSIPAPDRSIGNLYIIPARDAVCIYAEDPAGDPGMGIATCQSLAQVARQGGVYLQLVDDAGASSQSPFAAPGRQFRSTVLGVASDDARSVSATTADGRSRPADVSSSGAFLVAGTGLTELTVNAAGAPHASELAHP